MATSHGTLARGGVLWGMGFSPQITVPPNDVDGIVTHIDGDAETGEIAVGVNLNMDGVLAASDATDDNAYLPGAMSLQFEGVGTWDATWLVTGRNQFGDVVSESVNVAPSAGTVRVMTNHCYSFVASIACTAVTGWTLVGDTLDVGFEHNDNADCPYPLPFRVKDTDHVQAIAIAGSIFDGTDITVSTVYNTVTVATAATNVTGLTTLTPATISLVNGAAQVY